jgi:hypothetical protein
VQPDPTSYWHTQLQIAYTSNFTGIIPTRDDISPHSPPVPSQLSTLISLLDKKGKAKEEKYALTEFNGKKPGCPYFP